MQNTNSVIRLQTVANQDHTCCVTEYIIRILGYERVYMPLSEGSIIYTCEARSCPLKTYRRCSSIKHIYSFNHSFIQDAKFLFILLRPNVFTQPNTGSTLIDVVRKQPIVKTSLSGGSLSTNTILCTTMSRITFRIFNSLLTYNKSRKDQIVSKKIIDNVGILVGIVVNLIDEVHNHVVIVAVSLKL